jgi:hypothetical protein
MSVNIRFHEIFIKQCHKGFPGLIETAEAKLFKHRFMLKFTFLGEKYNVEVLIGFSQYHWNSGICFCSLIEIAESASAVSMWLMISNDYLKISRRIRITNRNGFSKLGPIEGTCWWKNLRVENLVTLSL